MPYWGMRRIPNLINKFVMVDLEIAFVGQAEMGVHVGVNSEYPILHGIPQ